MYRDKNKTENVAFSLIKFCLPLILSGILQQLYNWADAFIVGNVVGEEALAAIGSTSTVINFFLTAITGFTLGLSILFAQKFGGGKMAHISKILSVFSVVMGVAFFGCAGNRDDRSVPVTSFDEYDTGYDSYGKGLSADHPDWYADSSCI